MSVSYNFGDRFEDTANNNQVIIFFGVSVFTWNEGEESGEYLVFLRFNEDGKVNDSPDSIETKALVSIRDIDCASRLTPIN